MIGIGVAYGFPSSDPTKPHDIRIIKDWGVPGAHDKIPSVISYSEATIADEQQWGLDLSPNALAMVNTKMELDVQDRKLDELELILQVLDGVNDLNHDDTIANKGFPEYTWKSPEQGISRMQIQCPSESLLTFPQVATDYLSKVFQYLDQKVDEFGQKLRSELPVDIVITVPVVSQV
jgi:hypothetical protein